MRSEAQAAADPPPIGHYRAVAVREFLPRSGHSLVPVGYVYEILSSAMLGSSETANTSNGYPHDSLGIILRYIFGQHSFARANAPVFVDDFSNQQANATTKLLAHRSY